MSNGEAISIKGEAKVEIKSLGHFRDTVVLVDGKMLPCYSINIHADSDGVRATLEISVSKIDAELLGDQIEVEGRFP